MWKRCSIAGDICEIIEGVEGSDEEGAEELAGRYVGDEAHEP